MTNNEKKRCLNYGRVSDKKQKIEGSGLTSQLHRLRQYAEEKGYEIEAEFADDITGGGSFMKRPEMMKLINHIKSHPETEYIVLFDDLKRFARDTAGHMALRATFAELGARIECLNYNFGDTPEDEFVETIFAAQGQLERKQNARQTKQKQKARLEQGYWQFKIPKGYEFRLVKGQGKQIFRKEPEALYCSGSPRGLCIWTLPNQSRRSSIFYVAPQITQGA